jgi:DNA-binding CsgD family transcriptional regulator
MIELKNDDVIGMPGQNLSELEREILVAMANGNAQPAIMQATQIDPATFRMLELQVRKKLGASTPGHMVSRGFVLGVLLPRALCALIATSCVIAGDQSSNRNRMPARSRIPASMARTTRAGTGSRNGYESNILMQYSSIQAATTQVFKLA